MKKYLNETSILFIFDILTFIMMWIIFADIFKVYKDIDTQKQMISYYGGFSFILVGLIIPILHILVTIEFFKPCTFQKGLLKKIGLSKLLIVTLVILFVTAFIVKHYVRNSLEKNGYIYCKTQSKMMTFSEKLTFFKNGNGCNDKH